ncbi:MAG: hypothetical protein ACOCRO_00670 [Halanaerobiales bacterium]
MDKFISALAHLYNYGEIKCDKFPTELLNWMLEQSWLIQMNNHLVISSRWIDLTAVTKDEDDFINHLFAFNPLYQQYLLLNLLQIGVDISKAEDNNELINYVTSLPELAPQVINLYEELKSRFNKELSELSKSEWQTLKTDYNSEFTTELDKLIFGGKIQYAELMSILKVIQKVDNKIQKSDVTEITKKVDDNWVKGRRITSNPYLKPVKESKYVLVPSKDKYDFVNLGKANKYLNNPWGVFLILLGMTEKQLRAEKNDRINLRPDSVTEDPFNPARINFYTYLEDGREVLVDNPENVIEDFLDYLGMSIFPANKLDLTEYFTELLTDEVYIYKNEEYIMSDQIDSLLYKKPLMIVLKKYAKDFTIKLKEYVERLANSYED